MTRKKGNSFFCSFPEETTKFNSEKIHKFVFAHTHEDGGMCVGVRRSPPQHKNKRILLKVTNDLERLTPYIIKHADGKMKLN
jgi:hypothetical protein